MNSNPYLHLQRSHFFLFALQLSECLERKRFSFQSFKFEIDQHLIQVDKVDGEHEGAKFCQVWRLLVVAEIVHPDVANLEAIP